MHLYGPNIGNLSVYQRIQNRNATLLWQISGQQRNDWILGQLTLPNTTAYYDLIFEATVGEGGTLGNIALDDILLVRDGSCEYFNSTTLPPTTTTLAPPFRLECDFETSLCDWFNTGANTHAEWKRQNGQNAKFGTAPLTDVTLKNTFGYYAYVNASSSTNQLDTAILKSPTFNLQKDTCLEFWYQLGGPLNTALKVVLNDKSFGKSELWRRSGNKADTWNHAYVTVPYNRTDRSLEFDTDISKAFSGYVAIDEIKLILESCPTTQYCDFESPNICGYQNDPTADLKWERRKGKSILSTSGPSFDHTYQSPEGFIMQIIAKSFLVPSKTIYIFLL
jgi:hypothetical protein